MTQPDHDHRFSDPHDENLNDYDAPKSKTRLKKEMQDLQGLGAELVKLSSDRLKKMDLPEELYIAVRECQRITQNGALRRQRQYIGKIMRGIDPAPIEEQLAALRGESNAVKAEFHALENWRSRLLEHESAVAEWVQQHPDTDVQHLRNLIRNARKEAEMGKPPKSSRELFRMLRELTGN